jgi:ribosome recycling factor
MLDGTVIRINIPPMDKISQKMVKIGKRKSEEAKAHIHKSQKK